jgi:putative ATP-dependent endonuclease of OLD family
VTLKLLEIERLVRENERDHTFVAIEEPEAHLHPHLQRQVYRDFLRLRPHLSSSEKPLESLPATILLTTHSPHIASIAPLRSIVLLRSVQEDGAAARSTIACAAARADLTEDEEEDIERYLEVSRAELLFSRAVILVEGDAELYVVPRLAELLGCVCDQSGISVTSIGGTHFESYAVLLNALGIPFAIVTDADPTVKPSGISRARKLLARLGEAVDTDTDEPTIRALAAQRGIFIGAQTLELDLCEGPGRDAVLSVLENVGTTKPARQRATDWRKGVIIDPETLLKDVKNIGKGRFAQRLVASEALKTSMVPSYIKAAIDHLVEKLG